MSSFEDDLSDASSIDEFNGDKNSDPPSLDETLYDLSLFTMFLNYMKGIGASSELMFLKQAGLLRMFNAPPEVYAQQVIKTIWSFFAECAKMPVKVSHDVKKKLIEISLDPEAQKTINKDTLAVAYMEIYNAVLPVFYEWTATGEWTDAVPFHRLAPPSFNIVLTSNSLRLLFNKYINTQLENDSDGTVSRAYHLWKFCIVANDFRDGKCNHLLESKKAKKGKKDSDSVSSDAKSETSVDSSKEVDPEDYAKRVYKKYHNHLRAKYDETTPCAVYIIDALNQAIDEFDKSPLFNGWIKLKQYQGVDYQNKVVHQSLTSDGYVEPPTFAGVLASSMLPFFRFMLAGRESGLNAEFLIEVLGFRAKFDTEKEKSTSSASTEVSRKEMIEEARGIYAKYLEPGTMYCDPHLVEEVRNTLSKSGGKGVTSTLFRRCAAFIYHRSEHSWGRQCRASLVWANKSYDNHADAARAIEEEFSMSVLPEGIDLQIVPTVDDTFACPALLRDFADFAGKEVNDAFLHFRDAYEEYFKAPADQKKACLEKVSEMYGDCAELFPKLKPVHRVFVKEIGHRKRIADSVLTFLSYTIIRAVAKKYYSNWLVERSMTWKTVPWTPVSIITYSDMGSVYGMSSVQRKIEENALKGKSGLSRFLAKRALKKQSIANVRTGHSGPMSDLSPTMFNTTSASHMLAFASPRTASDTQDQHNVGFAIPTIQETLSSTYLRKHFVDMHLRASLSPGDFALWEALSSFYAKYSAMDDSGLADSQDAMRKEISEICVTYSILLKRSSKIEERMKKEKTIFPQFFRSYEVELYRKHHEEYQKTLRSRGLK